MYKRTNPQQNLFGVETQLSTSLRNRLESSWAQLFRIEILPILFRNEDQYAMLYGKTGRPNFSVARLLGRCLLQELNDLSDQQALDTSVSIFAGGTHWTSVTTKIICRAVHWSNFADDWLPTIPK
jgi:hypothetical protein